MDNRNQGSNTRGHLIAIVMALIIGVIGTLYGLNHPRPAPISGDGLTVHYIDVGQGDSALVTCDGETMLIDGGGKGAGGTVTEYLQAQGVQSLDVLVATHPHLDHCGGLDTVVVNVPVKTIYSPVTESDNAAFTEFADAVVTAGATITVPEANSTFPLGGATVTVLGPLGDYERFDNVNNQSIVLRIDYGETSFLFPGDAEYEEETLLLDAGANVRCDVLKAGHHGSNSSTGYRLLYEAEPTYCIISCGANNEYGHPHEDTLSRLRDAGVTVYRTDESGTIVCTSDGVNLTFTTEK